MLSVAGSWVFEAGSRVYAVETVGLTSENGPLLRHQQPAVQTHTYGAAKSRSNDWSPRTEYTNNKQSPFPICNDDN